MVTVGAVMVRDGDSICACAMLISAVEEVGETDFGEWRLFC